MKLKLAVASLAVIAMFGYELSKDSIQPPKLEFRGATNLQKSTIGRDAYGIPHIYSDSQFGLFYGHGYALGQDRLLQVEMAKRGAQGRASEVLGVEYLEGDKRIRQGLDPEAIHRQIEALSSDLKEPFKAYAAGINVWIDTFSKNLDEHLPGAFNHFDVQPSSWSAYDVFTLFTGTVAQTFCDSNEEQNNLASLRQLTSLHAPQKGWAVFDATRPLYDSRSPVTVPEGVVTDITRPQQVAPPYLTKLTSISQPPVRMAYSDSGKPLSIPDAAEQVAYLELNMSLSAPAGNSGFRVVSNVWISNGEKVTGAKAVLISRPQMGWGGPSYIHA